MKQVGAPGRVLADFEGQWHLSRHMQQIEGGAFSFEGQALWAPCAEGLRYVEEGHLQVPGQPPLRAERRFLWKKDLTVWFEDGRFFHKIPALGGDAAHWCAPDQYDGHYDFAQWPIFVVTWSVRGPHKAYHMRSEYRRTIV